MAGVTGRTGAVSYPDSKTVRLTLPAAAGTAYVYVGSHASLNSSDNVVTLATNKVNTATTKGYDTLYSNNQTWWQNYWSKSYVNISSDSTTTDIQKNTSTIYTVQL